MPSPKHLPEDRLRALHDAAVQAGLTEYRDELLLGIEPGIRSNLPFAASPSAQILSDLFHLADTTQPDGGIPVIPWIRNAIVLLGAQELVSVFEDTLRQLSKPVPARRSMPSQSPADMFADRAFDEGRGSRFLDRLEHICKLKEPEALVKRYDAPYPFAGVLEIVILERPVVRCDLVVALEQPLSEDALSCFEREVLPRHALGGVDEIKLVHLPPAAPEEFVRRAFRRRAKLIPFDTFQGLINFSRYRAWLSNRLDTDLDYPPWLYVEQPADISISGQPPVKTERALDSLCDLLATPEPRFALVLGKFGAGKTFLLREVARRLLEEGSIVPVLVEMRFLEKESSLRSLLSQHFGHADAGYVDPDRFLYMLREGKIALLFDGFDELAVRVTYDRVLHYFATVLEAVGGHAKVVVSSRTEHFLDDRQIKKELARRAESVQGYRLVGLRDFGEAQVRQFLKNRLKDEDEAKARHALICEIHDLLGLSENPRMLSFIADLEKERLEAARGAKGEITPAKLYALLLERWLARESERAEVSLASLWTAVRNLARTLWATPGQAVELGAMPRELVPSVEGPLQHFSPEEARLVLGSRSLLKRDARGMFSFVHRSVLEWLVAGEAAKELAEGGKAEVLVAEAMSPLMARFFVQLAARERAEAWAREVFGAGDGGHAERNALKVAGELGVAIAVNLEGRDLRGEDLDGVKLIGANLRNANLESVVLAGRDLTGAILAGARLAGADLRGALLRDADLNGADLTFANMARADLTGAKLAGVRMLGTKLLGCPVLSPALCTHVAHEGGSVAAGHVTWEIRTSSSACRTVAFHPCGYLLATGHRNGAVTLWDTTSGIPLRTLQDNTSKVWSLAFSPDGRSLAAGSEDTTVKLWDPTSAMQIRTLQGHKDGVLSVAFSPDGSLLASGSNDTTVALWDTASGTLLRTIQDHKARVLSVAFSPDGHAVVSGSDDRTLQISSLTSGTRSRSLRGHNGSIWSICFSPDGNTLASGSSDTTVELWDTTSGARLRSFRSHKDSVFGVAFSPDGRTLASASADSDIELWDSTSVGRLRSIQGHRNRVRCVAFSPDGRTLASGSDDKTVGLWDPNSGIQIRSLQGHNDIVTSVTFSPDGRTLVSGHTDKTVGVWSPASGARLRYLQVHQDIVSSVAFSPDGRTIASGSQDKTVALLDRVYGVRFCLLQGHRAEVRSIAFSPDGRAFASGSSDNTVGLWELASGTRLRSFQGHKDSVFHVAFSPDSRFLASCARDGSISLWTLSSGVQLRSFQGHKASVWSMAFSPDGLTLASSSSDRTIALWNLASGARGRSLLGHAGSVRSVMFSPNGKWLASGSDDTTIGLWDPVSGARCYTLQGHKAPVQSIAFSPDSKTLASGSADGTIRLWDVATGRCRVALLGTPEGWVAFIPEGPRAGAFKLSGNIAGAFWHIIGLARFEPGELDEFLPDDQKLRLPDDHRFLPA